jgi:transcription antitermination factor NusG
MSLMEDGEEKSGLEPVRHWHALYTRHQHEKSVAQVLTNKGQEVFLPLVRATHHWQDRTKQIQLPLYPCYVFIRGGFDHPIQILSTPGLICVVTCAGRPAIIHPGQIDAVGQLIASALQVESHPYLQCGDRVRVIAGPLRGIEGLLVRKKNSFRLVVSVEILARSAAVEIDVSCIESCTNSQVPVAMQSQGFFGSTRC